MKIYFCDGCNESIPLGDIQAGQATTIKGKLFCRNCIPVGAAPSGQPAPEIRTRHSPVLVLLVLALLGWTLWRDLPGLVGSGEENATADPGAEVARRLSDLDDELRSLRNRADEQKRRLDFQRAAVDGLRAADGESQRTLDTLRTDADRLVRGQADIGGLIEKINLGQNRVEVLESRVDVLADKVYAHDQLIEMGVASSPSAPAMTPSPEVQAADLTRQAEVDAIRRQLLDPDPGTRFDGVHRVGQGRYKELAGDLVGMLRDEDPFVRERAMAVLGDFGHVEAAPSLLDALGDPLVTIRRTAADTLVRLTGYDPGYDPRASKGERDRAAERWREWFESQQGT